MCSTCRIPNGFLKVTNTIIERNQDYQQLSLPPLPPRPPVMKTIPFEATLAFTRLSNDKYDRSN
jgi:hypothetical protein